MLRILLEKPLNYTFFDNSFRAIKVILLIKFFSENIFSHKLLLKLISNDEHL